MSNWVSWTYQLFSSMIEEIEVLVEEVYYGRCGWDSYLFEGKIVKKAECGRLDACVVLVGDFLPQRRGDAGGILINCINKIFQIQG